MTATRRGKVKHRALGLARRAQEWGLSSVQHVIVFLDRESVGANVRQPGFPHSYKEYQSTWTQDEILDRLKDATIAIINKVPMRADTLKQLPKLKLIAVAATGTDVVDKAHCAAHGIAVSNIRGYAVATVPEHTFALMLALRRNLLPYRQDVLRGRWQESGQFCFFDHAIHDLAGARLGIIGDGVLGQRVADIARAFGMVPLFAAHKGSTGMGPLYTPWQEVLETSDVITLHAPLMPATRHMISRAEFAAM
jgi:glycerate dehydrogenase